VFGHFLVPFLSLLRIDAKLVFRFMVPLCVWIGLMQYVDLSFNIMPVLHPDGFALRWICWTPAAWLSWGRAQQSIPAGPESLPALPD